MDITQVSTKVDNLQWLLKNIDWSSSDSIQFINIAGFVREDENYGYKIVKITFFPFPVFLNAKNGYLELIWSGVIHTVYTSTNRFLENKYFSLLQNWVR